MDSNINDHQPDQNEKHSGGSHIFLFLGGGLIALIILKLLIDWMSK